MHLRCLLHGAVLRRRVRVGGDPMKVSCPEERVRKVCGWIAFEDESGRRVNYSKMVAIMRMCHRAVDDGTLVNRDIAYYEALRMGWGIADAEDVFKRDHDFWSVLARYMVMLRPRLARCINFKRAPVDDAPLVEVWHEVVDPLTLFLAESWEAAKEAVRLGDASAA